MFKYIMQSSTRKYSMNIVHVWIEKIFIWIMYCIYTWAADFMKGSFEARDCLPYKTHAPIKFNQIRKTSRPLHCSLLKLFSSFDWGQNVIFKHFSQEWRKNYSFIFKFIYQINLNKKIIRNLYWRTQEVNPKHKQRFSYSFHVANL